LFIYFISLSTAGKHSDWTATTRLKRDRCHSRCLQNEACRIRATPFSSLTSVSIFILVILDASPLFVRKSVRVAKLERKPLGPQPAIQLFKYFSVCRF
jgi:hypothetical protein